MKIVVFYHAFLYGDHYQDVIGEQFQRILASGLFQECEKIYIGIIDSQKGEKWVRDWWHFTDKVNIVFHPENNELADTMKMVRDHAADNPEDYILFLHSKGVSHYDLPTEDWRRYMDYFNIDKWRDCVMKLNEGYDCSGIMWNSKTVWGNFPHFSGAFWWARAEYINRLDHSYLDKEWKYYREFWIGSAGGKVFEFHNSRMNDIEAFNEGRSHYSLRYHRENYADEEFFGLEKYHNKTLAKLNMEDGLYLTDKGCIHDYLNDYDKLFAPLREKPINIFEVGFQYGGSCKLWEKYFPYAKIRAIDISTERPYEKDAIRLGIKTEFKFGSRVTMEIKNMNSITQEYFEGFTPDIAIDDGSHTLEDQLYFIKTVYPVLNKGGILIIEDIQDIINQRKEFEELGIPFEIVDRRYVCYDNVLLIYRK